MGGVMRTWFRTEDGLAVVIGLFIVALGLLPLAGVNALGWVVKTSEWVDIRKAMAPVAFKPDELPGVVSLLLSFLFLLAVLSAGALCLGLNLRRFVLGFTALFAISYLCWLAGSYAYIASTPDTRPKFGIDWSLGLTGEAGFIVALIAGLVLGIFSRGVPAGLGEPPRPEWYIKTAIVILG